MEEWQSFLSPYNSFINKIKLIEQVECECLPRAHCHCETRVIIVKELVILNVDIIAEHKLKIVDLSVYLQVVQRVGLFRIGWLPGKAATNANKSK